MQLEPVKSECSTCQHWARVSAEVAGAFRRNRSFGKCGSRNIRDLREAHEWCANYTPKAEGSSDGR